MAASSTLITVAPTGAEADKAAVPALPVTLPELVVTAKECKAAGRPSSMCAPSPEPSIPWQGPRELSRGYAVLADGLQVQALGGTLDVCVT